MSFYGTAFSICGVAMAVGLAVDSYAEADMSSLDAKECIHWVKAGDNLSAIATNYSLNVQELVSLNQMDLNSELFAGQAVNLPPSLKHCDITTTPMVKALPELLEDVVDYNYASSTLINQKGKDKNDKKNQHENVKGENFVCGADLLLNTHDSGTTFDSIDTSKTVSPVQSAFGERPYSYFGSTESLADVMKNFAASYYIPLVLAEDVVGEVNGKIGPLTPVDFLDHMSNIYGFIWYFDGHTLYAYNASASQQKILSLSYIKAESLENTLKKVGVWDNRFFWKAQQKEGLVFVSGPPRYIELVSQTAMLLDEKEGIRQKSKLTVCTFNLKYAWATDKSYSFRGDQVTVPGVATILQNIINGGGIAQIADKELLLPTAQPASRVSRSARDSFTPKKNVGANQNDAGFLNDGAVAETIFINADPRQNAVIVHDLESKMRMYSKLVKSLDKPTAQIEISVSIIDVSTAKLEALGVDYNNTRESGDSNFIFDTAKSGQAFPSFSTIISANIGGFNAKINMLANDGEARIISRPSIITLDNLEAVLDNSSTSYVKVEANQDAQLFPIVSGTVVQVTPRIVRETDSRKIHMSINIQDGRDASKESQSVPIINNSSLNTQAIVHESESLLIGGFYREENETSTTKIPVLGDLPILGTLFRSDKKSKSRKVRMFLITPRIIELKRT